MIHSPWGKTRDGTSHHLAHHCGDVAACFEAMATLPVIADRLEKVAGRALSQTDVARLAVLVFLHDCGKLHPGFQAKGWPAGLWKGPLHGHVQEGAAIFDAGVRDGQLARNLQLEHLQRWCDPDLLHAALAHHGSPFEISPAARKGWDGVPANGYDPLAASAGIGALLPRWFPAAFGDDATPLPDRPHFQHLFCGLVSLADWLGSDERSFDHVAELDPDYIDQARQKARQVVAGVGLDVAGLHKAIRGRADFATLAPGCKPHPAQQDVGGWPLDDPLVILEAETGSGKTEAALWRFARLFEAGRVDSLYFALPTRAAALQIHSRVNKALQALFGADAPEAVLAVPGYLKAGEAEGQALPDFRVLWTDDADEPRRLARWAAENARRYLAATVAVGTVDQAMLAALQVRHAHLRAAALSRSLLVVDEVHASDRYMSEIQGHLLKMHLARGGHAMLMSATLGAEARTKWLALRPRGLKLPSLEDAVSTPYPAVWGHRHGLSPTGKVEQAKPVLMELVRGWSAQDAAGRAIAAAGRGAKVLVIRNTVKAAVETFAAVQEMGGGALLWQVKGGPALHHARFAPEDRKLLDEAVEHALSRDSAKRPVGGMIVIGTQTLEQSLDVDADLLISDLCPADVLLQRIGRLHRHRLPRPEGFDQPQCMVLSPPEGLDAFAAPKFDNGLGGWKDASNVLQGIYRNLHACELTRRLVAEHREWRIPDMNRLLVEGAVHPDAIARLNAEKGEPWESYWQDVYGDEIAQAQSGQHLALAVDAPFGAMGLFAADEEKVRTRLGAEGVVLRLAEPVAGPFGEKVSSFTLPAHWSQGIEAEAPVEALADDGVLSLSIGPRVFRYDRQGLYQVKSQ